MATSLEHFFGGHKGATLYVNAQCAASVSGLKNSAMEQLMMAGNYVDFSKNQDGLGNVQQASDVHQDFVDFLITTAKAHAEFDVIKGVSAGYQAALDRIRANLTDAFISSRVANGVVDQIFNVANVNDITPIPYNDRVIKSNILGDCNNAATPCRTVVFAGVDFRSAGLNENEVYGEFVKGRGLDAEYSAIIDSTQRAFTALNRGGVAVVRSQLLNEVSGTYDIRGLRSAIVAEFDRVAKAGVVTASGAAKRLNDVQARNMFLGIFGKWADLLDAQRNFFTKVVGVLSQPNGHYVDPNIARAAVTAGHGGPEVLLTDVEIANIVSDINAGNLAHLGEVRLNLNKDNLNRPVFKSVIPDVPNGSHFWVTVGSLGRGDVTDVNTFRDIYQSAYAAYSAAPAPGATNIAGVNVNLTAAAANRSNDFTLNYPVFLRNVQNALDNAQKAVCPDDGAVGNCGEDLPNFTEYIDMAFGKVWQWDSDKKVFFRTVNGNRIDYDKDVLDANNCYGTYLDASPDQCKRIIDCLADGNPKILATCMDILADKNLWNIAADDVCNVHPSVVKTVLRKFDVRAQRQYDDDGKEYKVPMTFEQWETISLSQLDASVQKAIKGNDKLLNYLKGLLAACDANPAIINKFQPKLQKRGMGPHRAASNYVTRLFKKQYFDPRDAESDYAIAAAQLRALPYGTLFPTLFSPSLGSFHNASFFSNQNVPAMFGGAYAQNGGNFGVPNKFLLTSSTRLDAKNLTLKDGSGNIFEGLFKAIKAGLSDMGVAMNPSDEKSIKAAVEKLKEIEQKLIAIVRRLSIAVRIGETLGAHHFVGDRQRVAALPLETVRTNEGARKFMENHVRELRDAYETLHGHYGNISTDLVTQVYPRYLDRCCEKKEVKGPEFVDLSEPCE